MFQAALHYTTASVVHTLLCVLRTSKIHIHSYYFLYVMHRTNHYISINPQLLFIWIRWNYNGNWELLQKESHKRKEHKKIHQLCIFIVPKSQQWNYSGVYHVQRVQWFCDIRYSFGFKRKISILRTVQEYRQPQYALTLLLLLLWKAEWMSWYRNHNLTGSLLKVTRKW